MFDLRYHLASLTAVFVALVLGILIGIGLSTTDTVRESDLQNLEAHIARLERERDAANARAAQLALLQKDTATFIEEAYPALIHDRLAGKRFALVFAGSIDERIRVSVERTLADGGAEGLARVRALELPLDTRMATRVLGGGAPFQEYEGDDDLGALGQDLAFELVEGGETPLWDAVSGQLVEEQEGGFRHAVDGVIVARTAEPQRGATTQFLAGFYRGLASTDRPAVGVETSSTRPSALESFSRRELSTIDHLDLQLGRLALALLLAGGEEGEYGLRGEDGILPLPIQPIEPDEE
jgi:Copper transport outer membrane protein, MctB